MKISILGFKQTFLASYFFGKLPLFRFHYFDDQHSTFDLSLLFLQIKKLFAWELFAQKDKKQHNTKKKNVLKININEKELFFIIMITNI